MYRNLLLGLTATAISVLSPLHGNATPIFDTFGDFPLADFGGSGIPNEFVAASAQIVDGDTTITIALSAAQRFSAPTVTNDGAGTFFATAGTSSDGASLWNFNSFISVSSPTSSPILTDFQFDLFYDFDPAEDNALSTFGQIDITNSVALGIDPTVPVDTTILQGSQNSTFAFLSIPAPGLITPPAAIFDPDVEGEYTFVITVSNSLGFPIEVVAIDVVIPEPAGLTLLGVGGLALLRRRR